MLLHAELTRIETNAIAVIWFTNRMSTTLNGDRPNLVFGLGPSIYPDKSWHTPNTGSLRTDEIRRSLCRRSVGDESNRAVGQLG